MHPKAIQLMQHYHDLGQSLASLSPGSVSFIESAKERTKLEPFVMKYQALESIEKATKDTRFLLDNESDSELKSMAHEELQSLEQQKLDLEKSILLMLLPPDTMAQKNILLEIRAGTGGDEAALFAGDLLRMYLKFAEARRWKTELLSENPSGVGGYKEIILSVSGKDVYSFMKFESGVHRVQRIPVTESGGRIHTSTASVVVLPEATDLDVQIDEKDLKIDVYRASGAGGQHVNKTESAVRITHLPSGLVVTCQDERSQVQNKARALNVLRARLLDLENEKRQSEEVHARRSIIGSGDRSEKIRTYNFPENRVTDHRIKLTLYRLEQILGGDLDELLNQLIVSEQDLLIAKLGEM